MNVESLITDYQNGVKVKDLVSKYHCSTNTISKILDLYNIPKRAKKVNRKKDISKFKNLEMPETQYWLGFICADGNVEYDTKNRNYKVSLFSKDREVVDNFANYFGNDIVNIYQRKQNGVFEACICCKELCIYLINTLNIIPNKSLVLNPNIVYTSHFIRGYFDGDGYIRKSYDTPRYEAKITSGSNVFLQKIKEILQLNSITSSITKRKECNAYDLHIYNRINISSFFDFIYKGAAIYLSRKYNIFVALLGKPTDEKLGELLELQENQQPSQSLTTLEGSTTNS